MEKKDITKENGGGGLVFFLFIRAFMFLNWKVGNEREERAVIKEKYF